MLSISAGNFQDEFFTGLFAKSIHSHVYIPEKIVIK